MHSSMRVFTVGAVVVALAQPAGAQRGGAGRPPAGQRPQQLKPDTTKGAAGVSLDFQDQELRVVLDALAAAGELNVSLTDIPQKRVSLHMGRPVNRDDYANIIKTYAESQGLKVTTTPGLMQIAGTPPEPPQRNQNNFAQQLLAQNQAQQMQLYTVRLRHASAVQLAPVLMNLFSGFSGAFGGRGGVGTTVIPNGTGGFNIIGNAGGLATPAAPPNNIT